MAHVYQRDHTVLPATHTWTIPASVGGVASAYSSLHVLASVAGVWFILIAKGS